MVLVSIGVQLEQSNELEQWSVLEIQGKNIASFHKDVDTFSCNLSLIL